MHRFRTLAPRNTTAAGYGAAHQRERKRRLKLYGPDDLCGAGCGRRLGHDRSRWHLPHNADRTGYLPGFWCADCNIKDGARRGNARSRRQQVRRAQSQAW